jgi:hypothetical protein
LHAYQHAVYDWPVWVPVRTQKAIKKEKKAEENPRHGVKSLKLMRSGEAWIKEVVIGKKFRSDGVGEHGC